MLAKQKELNARLIAASKAYYGEDREIMSNMEYDRLCDELRELEEKTGVILAGSPTVTVGYEAVDELPKESHESPMLSLAKTKDRAELAAFLKGHPGVLSWKLDGLTVVVTYSDGVLQKAVTRGNGTIGEVITPNARTFINLPGRIPFKGELVIRGEAVISYSDFDRINSGIEDVDSKYKNPRNLCSGSVRQLDSAITAKRYVRFYAFSLVRAQGDFAADSRIEEFKFLESQGFDVVEHRLVSEADIEGAVDYFAEAIKTFDIPSDGLVLILDEISYGKSLGMTAKFPRDAMAFKWADETAETTLKHIEWSASRTGLINPVVVFEPVELEGTTVTRASVHNVSILKALKLGVGDVIRVYKANMIIPQISENLTGSGTCLPPDKCPVCGADTRINSENDVETLYCTSPDCPAKKIKAFTHFVSRDAMNIDGLSEATLEKFIAAGYIHSFVDLYSLEGHKQDIVLMEGFGEKSYSNLIASMEKSRDTSLQRLIYAMGIEGIGSAGAKLICRHFDEDIERMKAATLEEFSDIDGIGPVLAGALRAFFEDDRRQAEFEGLLKLLRISKVQTDSGDQNLKGLTFVVTGSLNIYANRDALKEEIERRGGKLAGSVSSKTKALVNNDTASTSSKNKKARELGIPILSEEDFIREYLGQRDGSTVLVNEAPNPHGY